MWKLAGVLALMSMTKGKGTVKIERVQGRAAGVNADGTPVVAYEQVRKLLQEQLSIVRERIKYYKEEEKYYVEKLASYPLSGQLPLIEEEE